MLLFIFSYTVLNVHTLLRHTFSEFKVYIHHQGAICWGGVFFFTSLPQLDEFHPRGGQPSISKKNNEKTGRLWQSCDIPPSFLDKSHPVHHNYCEVRFFFLNLFHVALLRFCINISYVFTILWLEERVWKSKLAMLFERFTFKLNVKILTDENSECCFCCP